jgi:hypothetical protein
MGEPMPSADRSYQQPSRGSRILITLLTVSVVLLAGWIVLSNTILGARTTPMVAQAPDPVLAPTQDAVPVVEQTAAIEPAAAPATIDSPAAEQVAEAESAPALPEPIVVASASGVPLPVPSMLPSLASSRTRLIEVDTRQPQTAAQDEGQDGMMQVVPLPPRRPKIAGIPLPRPRPDTEGAVVDRTNSQVLSDAEISRMQ